MARKNSQQASQMPLYLTISREEATRKIVERINRGEELKSRVIENKRQFHEVEKDYWTWNEYNEEMLRQMFTTTKIAEEYTPPNYLFAIGEEPLQTEIINLRADIGRKIRTLDSISERLELIPVAPGIERAQPPSQSAASISNDKIFLVHGHDEGARESVARFISQLGLVPVILHEQANRGRTVVEKLEHHGDVSYAIVLLTPDDVGGINADNLQPRARQNVVLELGYFMARLSRQNVCALYRGELELPSDYMGVIYIPYDSGGGWRLDLAKELKTAGFPIDMNKAI